MLLYDIPRLLVPIVHPGWQPQLTRTTDARTRTSPRYPRAYRRPAGLGRANPPLPPGLPTRGPNALNAESGSPPEPDPLLVVEPVVAASDTPETAEVAEAVRCGCGMGNCRPVDWKPARKGRVVDADADEVARAGGGATLASSDAR